MKLSALLLASLLPLTATAQIHHVAEMTSPQIASLDAAKTVVLLPGGILEEHGPHLPAYTDGYSNKWLTHRIAEAIVTRPGMHVLVFPTIPLGHGGANEIGGKLVFPGTYSVRRATLRAIFMDLATELGEQGFRKVVVLHGHGAPWHNLMLDQAGRYFRDTYGGWFVSVHGLMPTREQVALLGEGPPDLAHSDAATKEIGAMDEHAGFEETSRALFLVPQLVDAGASKLPSLTINSPAEFFATARAPEWPGYLSAPRLANASAGARLQSWRARRDAALVMALIDGKLDERDIPRYSAMMTGNPDIMRGLAASDEDERMRAKKQREWLVRNKLERVDGIDR